MKWSVVLVRALFLMGMMMTFGAIVIAIGILLRL